MDKQRTGSDFNVDDLPVGVFDLSADGLTVESLTAEIGYSTTGACCGSASQCCS